MGVKKESKKNPIVVRGESDPPDEILAAHIVEIANSMRKLMAGPMNERAIVLLIHDSLPKSAPVGKRDIAKVLTSIENLAHTFLKDGLG
jgi:hypothetical protein